MHCSTGCLAEHELLVLLVDEPDAGPLRYHVSACPECRVRLEELRSHLSELRAIGPVPRPSSAGSTGSDPRTRSSEDSQAPCPQEPEANGGPQDGRGTARPCPAGPINRGASSWDGNDDTTDREAAAPAAIGKYLVVDRFDKSGQAEVFRVVHPHFHRDLVLKLAKSPIDAAGRSAIIEEGRQLAGLEHPNIVRVHDLDFYENRPFLVMEYIRARTLAQYAREEKITPRRAAALVRDLAGAVTFAHRRGVVHQDIKPANILIDEAGRPRLIDFGLAWQQDAWSGPSSQSEGGTYAYIAPEQARLEPDRVRPLCDIFALGAVLYSLLTGCAPFAAATQAESRDRARRCEFDGSTLRAAGVPRRLERICLRTMATNPAARYATAEDLASDLDRWLRRPGRAIRAVATAALLLAAALSWRLRQPDPPHQQADPPARSISTTPRDLGSVPGRLEVGRPDGPQGPQSLVQVCREDQFLDLRDAVPLVTGDRLMIRCDLPRGLHASLFWFDTEGKLTELTPVAVNSANTRDQLLYPPNGVVPLTGPAGTELVLICARHSGAVGRVDVEPLLPCGRPLSPLPKRVVVRWDQDEFRVESLRGVGAPEASPTGEIQDLFNAIHRTSPQRFDFVAGVAFRHESRR